MHKSVLLKESVDALDLAAGEVFIDGTFGGGGHSREVLRRFPEVRVIALDRDPEVARSNPDFEIRTMSFADIDKLGERPDAILYDLGISSIQLENSGKGFSFQRDEPLDMRMGETGFKASDILNSWDESAIGLILHGFGEERYAKRIAEEIVRRRKVKLFESTRELIEAIEAVKPRSYKDKIHPATKTFQALRIAVNGELDTLEKGLEKGLEVLKPSGNFAVITFHSLEDRIVKNFFRNLVQEEKAILVNKKPITPKEDELESNPRSRSAKLRIIKKL